MWQVYKGKLRLPDEGPPPPPRGVEPDAELPEPPQGTYAVGIAPGDDLEQGHEKVAAPEDAGDLRFRIAEVENQSNFLVGVDAVKLKDD